MRAVFTAAFLISSIIFSVLTLIYYYEFHINANNWLILGTLYGITSLSIVAATIIGAPMIFKRDEKANLCYKCPLKLKI